MLKSVRFLTVIVLSFFSVFVYAAGLFLPFDVVIEGEKAMQQSDTASMAIIEEPVSNDALLEVGADSDSIIINIYPADSQGNMDQGAQPEIIMIQGDNTINLDETMSGNQLGSGFYLMNIVASGKTARVLFEVE